MYLHEDRESFKDIIEQVFGEIGRTSIVVEKDYYLQGKSKRYSRHLYDIYKLTPMMEINDDFRKLIDEVREHRAKMSVCPSAKDGVDVAEIIFEFCNSDFYKEDYQAITSYFVADYVAYDEAVSNICRIAESGLFG